MNFECIGFNKYEVYADESKFEHVGTIDGLLFSPTRLFDVLEADEIYQIAEFVTSNYSETVH